jgi:uncharacterized membrane protein YeiH
VLSGFTILLEIIGTFVFALSGIRMASGKQMDWFGAYIVGLVTAVGGGTLRDLLLNIPAFWMEDSQYFITTGVALLAALIFKHKLFRLGKTLFLFDAIGLGLFTVVGISKSLDQGYSFTVCIIMGAITGCVGGMIRDILINEVPLVLRRDIYALASIAGGLMYFLLYSLNIESGIIEFIAAGTVILIRLIAVKYKIHLPTFVKIDSGNS